MKLSTEELREMRTQSAFMAQECYVSALNELIAFREREVDQVPFGYVFEGRTGKIVFQRIKPILAQDHQTPIIELFTASQKPVVELHSGAVMGRAYVVRQIEAAGGTVKGGE